jgi:predicted DCC family thiol-disulfide oxidoreductase YuxK
MPPTLRTRHPPDRPALLFDGDCGFCRFWVRWWQREVGGAVELLPYQHPSVRRRFPELADAPLDRTVHFVAADGAIYAGAEAIFRCLAEQPAWSGPLRQYQSVPAFAEASESGYGFIARNRGRLSALARGCGLEQFFRPAELIDSDSHVRS